MSQPKAMQVKPLVSSVNEQDFTSDSQDPNSILFTTFIGIFFVVCWILKSFDRFIGLELLIAFVWVCVAFFSKTRLRVNHTMDELVLDSIFLGCRYWRKRKKLSDSLYLRCADYDADSSGRGGQRIYSYIIHGNSGKKRDWKLNISNMMRDELNPFPRSKPNKNKAKEIAKSIGIKFKSR